MNILVLTEFDHDKKEILKDIAKGHKLYFYENRENEIEDKSIFDAIIGNPKPKTIKSYSSLKWLQTQSAGVDWYLTEGISDEVIITNSVGAYGLPVSEHMLAMLLLLLKNLDSYVLNQKEHKWNKITEYRSVDGLNILILGLGDLGKEFAKRVHALGATVTAIKRNTDISLPYVEKVVSMDDYYEELENADVVINFLPKTDETYHIIDKKAISHMKDGVIILNGGRGSAINEKDLIDGLNSGKVYKAGIDVCENEPLKEDSPLWDAKGLFITPHTAGNYVLKQTKDKIFEIVTENLKRFCNGEDLINKYH